MLKLDRRLACAIERASLACRVRSFLFPRSSIPPSPAYSSAHSSFGRPLAGEAPTSPTLPPPASSDGFPALPFEPSDELFALYEIAHHPPALRAPNGSTNVWARDVYTPWMQARSETLAQVSVLRRSARSHPIAPTVAAGLHATLLEDTASQLDGLDLPDALRDAVREPIPALRSRALRIYEVCYELALAGGPALDGWHRLCGEGLSRLSVDGPRD